MFYFVVVVVRISQYSISPVNLVNNDIINRKESKQQQQQQKNNNNIYELQHRLLEDMKAIYIYI